MFTVEKLSFNKSASASETSINLESRRECENIMKRIYDEDPSYWPYGLDLSSHDGGVYMIREASTRKPIGFTGWQERMEGSTKVGYYSIGILPEYRNNGYAKQAVAKLISVKSANVDCVKALIMKHNKPSLALAESLHVPVEKVAMLKAIGPILKTITPAVFMDVVQQGLHKSLDGENGGMSAGDYLSSIADRDQWDLIRGANFIANLGFGAAATRGKEYLKDIANIPQKDLTITALAAIPKFLKLYANKGSESATPAAIPSASSSGGFSPEQKLALGLSALVAGGLGYKGVRALSDLAKAQQQKAKGKVTVTLPTKSPTDQETFLELPMAEDNLSTAQIEKLQRDVRRRLRKETLERTEKRPEKGKDILEPKEACAKNVSLQKIKTLLDSLHG